MKVTKKPLEFCEKSENEDVPYDPEKLSAEADPLAKVKARL